MVENVIKILQAKLHYYEAEAKALINSTYNLSKELAAKEAEKAAVFEMVDLLKNKIIEIENNK